MKTIVLAGTAIVLGISAAAIAQPISDGMPVKHQSMLAMMHQGMHGDEGHDMRGGDGSAAAGDQSPASLALRGVNEKMHRDMAIPLTGDADADFVRSMIPHHQGAIDMAKVVLAFGKDPDIRKLAEAIIAAQEKEIAEMRAWLSRSSE